MRLSKAELLNGANLLFDLMVEGKSDLEAMAEMGIDSLELYQRLKVKMFELKTEELSAMPTEHVFLQYVVDQRQNLKDLNSLLMDLKGTKQHNAMVGAIRLRADIHDRIIARGQEFGVISKEPDKKQVLGGVVIANMDDDELRGLIRGELRTVAGLMSDFGEGGILDITPGPLHVGPALKSAESRGTNKQPITENQS